MSQLASIEDTQSNEWSNNHIKGCTYPNYNEMKQHNTNWMTYQNYGSEIHIKWGTYQNQSQAFKLNLLIKKQAIDRKENEYVIHEYMMTNELIKSSSKELIK